MGKEWIQLNDKIMDVIFVAEMEAGVRVHYCAAECALCQGVNLSEAVRCDIIYSEIPNLSALIFQPQHCLSLSARDDWSIYKTAEANLLNIYVQCHVRGASGIYFTHFSLWLRTFLTNRLFFFQEGKRCITIMGHAPAANASRSMERVFSTLLTDVVTRPLQCHHSSQWITAMCQCVIGLRWFTVLYGVIQPGAVHYSSRLLYNSTFIVFAVQCSRATSS